MPQPYSPWPDSHGAGDRCRRAPVPAIGTARYTRPFVPRCLCAAVAPCRRRIVPTGAPSARGRRIANRATTAVPGPRRRHVFDAEERGVPGPVPRGAAAALVTAAGPAGHDPDRGGNVRRSLPRALPGRGGRQGSPYRDRRSRWKYARPGRVGTVRAGNLARGTVLALATVALVASPIRNANRECPVSHGARAGRW